MIIQNNIKTILYAFLAAAMILPMAGASAADDGSRQDPVTVTEEMENDPHALYDLFFPNADVPDHIKEAIIDHMLNSKPTPAPAHPDQKVLGEKAAELIFAINAETNATKKLEKQAELELMIIPLLRAGMVISEKYEQDPAVWRELLEKFSEEIDEGKYPKDNVNYSRVGENSQVFRMQKYPIIVNSTLVSDIVLEWDYPYLPRGQIFLKEPSNMVLEVQIPKSMPRAINADFSTSIFTKEKSSQPHVEEYETQCFYVLQIPTSSDSVEIATLIPATGRLQITAINNPECTNVYREALGLEEQKSLLNARGEIVSVFPNSVEKLIHRGYLTEEDMS